MTANVTEMLCHHARFLRHNVWHVALLRSCVQEDKATRAKFMREKAEATCCSQKEHEGIGVRGHEVSVRKRAELRSYLI